MHCPKITHKLSHLNLKAETEGSKAMSIKSFVHFFSFKISKVCFKHCGRGSLCSVQDRKKENLNKREWNGME